MFTKTKKQWQRSFFPDLQMAKQQKGPDASKDIMRQSSNGGFFQDSDQQRVLSPEGSSSKALLQEQTLFPPTVWIHPQ